MFSLIIQASYCICRVKSLEHILHKNEKNWISVAGLIQVFVDQVTIVLLYVCVLHRPLPNRKSSLVALDNVLHSSAIHVCTYIRLPYLCTHVMYIRTCIYQDPWCICSIYIRTHANAELRKLITTLVSYPCVIMKC